MGEYILALYERVKRGYNDYVELIGGAIGAGACAALKHGNKIYTINDDVPLLHFLTDVEEEEQGNDWLFTVIADIVNTHNQAIENLYNIVHSQKQLHLKRLLPEQPAKILPTEVTEKNCIVGTFTSLHGVSDFLQIIRSRYEKSSDKITQGPSKDEPEFKLKHLEEDLVRLFNAGKPLIESPSSIRTLFKFKQSSSPDVTVPNDVIRATLDLEEIGYRLPDEYNEPLSAILSKRLEYEFHSCGYNNLIEIITALRTVCGHLVKLIMEDAHPINEELTLPRFMMAYVYDHLSDPHKVLHEIGITPNSLKHSQLTCLLDIPLPSVFACLQCFVRWVDIGVYDFCNLPLAIKVHLSEEDVIFFDLELREKWMGTTKELESEVKKMIEVVKHSENDITRTVNKQAARVSIFKKVLLIDEEDKLPPLIPETVVLQHYVHFRLALRRLLIKLRAELATGADAQAQGNHWSEFVADLWNAHLPHLREETFGDEEFVFDPFTNRYGFEDQSYYSSDDELFMHDLENDGYDEVVMEGFGIDLAERDSFVEMDESISQPQVTHSYDLAQSTDEEEESDVEDVILSPQPNEEDMALKLLENPDFRRKVMSMEKSRDNEELAPKARTYTPEDVGDFFTNIKLDKYRQAFVEAEVGGDVLLDANCKLLNTLGVNSNLDCVRIMTLFPRRLQNAEPRLPISKVLKFFKENKFEKYVELFKQNEIDGDMLVDTEQELMRNVLEDIGIAVLDTFKILSQFKTFASKSM